MTKTQINSLIAHLKKLEMVTKVTAWSFQEKGNEKVEVRYVGLKLDEEWSELFSTTNLVLLSFVYGKNYQTLEIFLANSTPFVLIKSYKLNGSIKIEALLGDFRRQLKSDKISYQHHQDSVGNLYKKVVQFLKK